MTTPFFLYCGQNIAFSPETPLSGKDYDFIFLNRIAIHYRIKRSQRKSILLTVGHAGLVVSAPEYTSDRDIQSAILRKADWVLKKLSFYQERQAEQSSYTQNTILYKGHRLRVWESDEIKTPTRSNDILLIPSHQIGHSAQFSIENWMAEEAWRFFAQQISTLAASMDVSPHSFGLSYSKKSWGSCSSKGRILLNHKLICLPEKIIEYIIIHELAHLKEMNHGPAFWALVAEHCPHYSVAKTWLKEYDLETL